jgi:hypothetical protein
MSEMELKENFDKFIDIEKLFEQKNASLARMLPGFVFSYIKRIMHQDEINDFLWENRSLQSIEFLNKVNAYFNVTIDLIGKENFPVDTKTVFAANHPLGGLEGILLTNIIANHYGDARVPVNDLLLSVKNFKPLFIPINKHGSTSKEAIKIFDATYATDIPLLMFPSGYVSRKRKGVIKDIDWRKTFLTKAIKHGRSITPTFITGENSPFFYNLNILREALGIKANLEMFFLANELFKKQNGHLKAYFGPAIEASYFDKRYTPVKWAKLVQEYAYSLVEKPKRNFEQFVLETEE